MTSYSLIDPEIDAVWRAILSAEARTVAVVAAEPGEGTTTVASAIAHRAGQSGRRALLVEANPLRPTVAQTLGLRGEPGQIITNAGIDFSVLPDSPSSMVRDWDETARLREQFDAWKADWGMVVLDGAPLLSREAITPSPIVLAASADVTVLVTLAGRTASSRIRQAHHHLETAGARLIGVVLNDRDNPPVMADIERQSRWLGRLLPATVRRLKFRLGRSHTMAARP